MFINCYGIQQVANWIRMDMTRYYTTKKQWEQVKKREVNGYLISFKPDKAYQFRTIRTKILSLFYLFWVNLITAQPWSFAMLVEFRSY